MTTEKFDEFGPVDVIVLGYPKDSPMTGEAAEVALGLVERGVIRILDCLIVLKNEDGTFSGMKAENLTAERFGSLTVFEGASSGLLGDEDAQAVAEAMEPGEGAVVLMYENTWAAPFVAAVRRNGGYLIDSMRIRTDDLLAALDAVEAG